MANLTPNLGLFKYDPLTDTNQVFSFEQALNDNWDILDEKCGNSRNIGEIVTSTLPLTDVGLHLIDGSLILGGGIYQGFIDYIANLYTDNPNANYFCTETQWQQSVTDYGVCGKFVYDSVNNTVRLPKISNILQGTTDISALSDLIEAGLPALTISSVADHTHTAVANGKHTHTTTLQCWRGADGNTPRAAWESGDTRVGSGTKAATTSEFAAHTHTINGAGAHNHTVSWSGHANTSTVQPQTIKVLYYIVIATSSKTGIQVDIDEIATDLNGKADVDLTNVNNAGTSLGASWAMPSSTYTTLTIGASGTTYTAPANGWFAYRIQVAKATTSAASYVSLFNQTAVTSLVLQGNIQGASILRGYIPVNKGHVVGITYAYRTNDADDYLAFVYAEGSKGEA